MSGRMDAMNHRWLAGLMVGLLPCVAQSAHAYKLGVAVMDARSAGLGAGELSQLHTRLQNLFAAQFKGSDFELVPPDELKTTLADMPGCGVGTCDVQVAHRCEAVAVVSAEAVLQRGTYFLALRLYETRQGTLLAKSAVEAADWPGLEDKIAGLAQSLVATLKQAHAVALKEMDLPLEDDGNRGKVKRTQGYLLKPPGGPVATVARTNTPEPAQTGPRVMLDAETVQKNKVLRAITPGINACYETLLQKKKTARGRMVVQVDVETDGTVSGARVVSNELPSQDMERCVVARLKQMQFPSSPQASQVRFPLVFVPAK